ncbi:hypothetical protein, partial [Streptomyces decoyicus]|uniref:hypothetical protein n=1 Tax=Streptomyces decoyicus TaxID=249567 RepID=UPI0033A1935D
TIALIEAGSHTERNLLVTMPDPPAQPGPGGNTEHEGERAGPFTRAARPGDRQPDSGAADACQLPPSLMISTIPERTKAVK